jgi:hypothetical protein
MLAVTSCQSQNSCRLLGAWQETLPAVLERLDITSAEMDLTIDQNSNLPQSLFILLFTSLCCNVFSTEFCL